MADVLIDEGALAAFIASQHGVAAELERRIIGVQNVATQIVHVDTGRLRASIDHELGVDAQGPYADCSANTEYALIVELRYPYLRPALHGASGDGGDE